MYVKGRLRAAFCFSCGSMGTAFGFCTVSEKSAFDILPDFLYYYPKAKNQTAEVFSCTVSV